MEATKKKKKELDANSKHGGGGVRVWGCISSKGVGHLKKVSGCLNATGYIEVLENNDSQHTWSPWATIGYFSRIRSLAILPIVSGSGIDDEGI